MTLRLLVDRVRIEPPGQAISDWCSALVNIEGDFAVHLPSGLLLQDSHWCVVELAHELRRWLALDQREDFFYTSMDDEEEGLLWFRQEADDAWRVGSAWQRFAAEETFSHSTLVEASLAYVRQVEDLVRAHLRIDLVRQFPEYGARGQQS